MVRGVRALITGGAGDIAREVAGQLKALGWEVIAPRREVLDVTMDMDVADMRRLLVERDQPLHALVNCAGVASWGTGVADATTCLNVNTLGAMRVTGALLPLLARGARVVMVTSELADRARLPLAAAAYAMSKAALNVLARAYATEHTHLVVRAVCPGHVRTKMNPAGTITPEEGAAKIVRAVVE